MSKLTVKRANIVLDISSEDKEYYMQQGYSVIDESGNIVEKALSSDVGQLQLEVTQLSAQLQNLKGEIAKKDAEIKRLKARKADKE